LGRFRSDAVPPGSYLLLARSLGRTDGRDSVRVLPGQVARLDLVLGGERVVGRVREIEVIGSRRQVRADQIGTRYTMDQQKFEEYHAPTLAQVVAQQAGVVNTNGVMHLEGSRGVD